MQSFNLYIKSRIILICCILVQSFIAGAQSGKMDIVPVNGRYAFGPAQLPDQIVSVNSSSITQGYTFQWSTATSPEGTFTNISGATSENLVFSAGQFLTQNRFYRRTATKPGETIVSNVIRYELASANWEDMTYIREHTVLRSGKTGWKLVDDMPIGEKLVATTYFDGLGRPIQTVEKGVATPASGSSTWGDIVQYSQYDNLGRSTRENLPYSTTTSLGVYKTNAPAATASYYTTNYSDNTPYSQIGYDASPLNRVLNSKAPGAAWAASAGNSANYLLNTSADDVKRFVIGDTEVSMPVLSSNQSFFPANTLMKIENTDELGKKVVSYLDNNGQLILKKVQLADAPTNAYTGWICTYYVYDDFGRLRCEINPEGVKWLAANGWSFSANNGSAVFYEQCFVYAYDDKGRTIYKKQPGQKPLYMIYDLRDRLVLTQDGNQRLKSPAEWTAYTYDELDRIHITTLYRTTSIRAALTSQANTTLIPIVTTAQLANTSICTVLTTNYYDNYSFPNAATFDATAATTAAVVPAGSEVLPITRSNRLNGFSTGKKTLILGTTTYLMTTNYYDENGSEIQTLSTNIKGGTDVSTNQYGWDGRLLANASKHSVAGSDYNNYYILTKLNYDQIGRVASQEKKFGTNAWKVISQLNYDDLGRVGGKRLDPSYAEHFSGIGPVGGGLEYLKYSYNVQGRLIGINKDYAQKVDYNKWGNFFGIYLSYADAGGTNFSNAARFNGQLRGVIWNSQGDAEQRRYQYTYDNAGRLTKSEFANRVTVGGSWSSTQLDFSEGYGTNTINYDLNGNLTVLTRKGVQFGNNSAVIVDDLRYTYENFSNKLKAVTDITSVASTATVGDFKDVNTTINDYVYDDNGNLVVDLNKNIKNLVGANGVTYNHLDKPVEIKIEGKGTVKITYDADGAKLKREFLNSTTNANKVTWYLGEYQYEEVVGGPSPKTLAVSFISFGEGRIRPITPRNESNTYDALQLDGNLTLPNGKKGSIDYFISDHRTDVRMILTEEKQWSYTTASMETASSRNTVEEGLFSTQVNLSRAPKTEVPGWTANTSQYVSKLNNTRMVGPNQMLKVMAGDLLHANVQYYYQQVATNSTGSTVFGSVLSMLGSSITGSAVTSAATKAASSSIIANLNTGLPFSQVISPDITSSTGNLPKAYLNVVFFDERFNFVSESSTSVRVGAANVAANLALTQIKAPENGYCYVYISNESTVSVYFDNLQVRHDRGRIVEENHYYAYGLRINAISSKAYGGPANNYLYQGDFAELDEDLGWTDFMLRSYDAEIGRFLQEDPMNEFASGYFGMGGDPANLIDPTGGCVYCETAEKAMTLAEVTVTFVKKASTASNLTKAINLTVAFGNGLWNGAKGTYEFISSDMWKQQTWTQLGNVAMSLAIAHANNGLPSGKMAMIYIDQKLGTSYYFTYDALTSQITNFVERAPNMSAQQWAELSGEATFAIFGSKGLNAIKSVKVVKVATNKVVTTVGEKAKTAASTVAAAAKSKTKPITNVFQRHHIIPNQVFNKFRAELQAMGWKQNDMWNLKKLPVPFHGNHPAYNAFIIKQMNLLQQRGALNLNNMKNLQHDMRLMIGDAYRSGLKLNEYFK
jgi:RHS repeat-associated protein